MNIIKTLKHRATGWVVASAAIALLCLTKCESNTTTKTLEEVIAHQTQIIRQEQDKLGNMIDVANTLEVKNSKLLKQAANKNEEISKLQKRLSASNIKLKNLVASQSVTISAEGSGIAEPILDNRVETIIIEKEVEVPTSTPRILKSWLYEDETLSQQLSEVKDSPQLKVDYSIKPIDINTDVVIRRHGFLNMQKTIETRFSSSNPAIKFSNPTSIVKSKPTPDVILGIGIGGTLTHQPRIEDAFGNVLQQNKLKVLPGITGGLFFNIKGFDLNNK